MLETNDNCSCQKCSKAELEEELLFYEWQDDVPQIKKTLMKLLLIFIKSEAIEDHNLHQRDLIAGHVQQVISLLEIAEHYSRRTEGIEVTTRTLNILKS